MSCPLRIANYFFFVLDQQFSCLEGSVVAAGNVNLDVPEIFFEKPETLSLPIPQILKTKSVCIGYMHIPEGIDKGCMFFVNN